MENKERRKGEDIQAEKRKGKLMERKETKGIKRKENRWGGRGRVYKMEGEKGKKKLENERRRRNR